jgi:hypothetical protein
MLKKSLKTLQNITKNVCVSFKRDLHSNYRPSNLTTIKVKSLATTLKNIQAKYVSDVIVNVHGYEMELEYYDSHLHDPSMQYGQSSIKTVFLLPSGEHTIDLYEELIGSLSRPKCRVVALSFPGTGKSKLIDKDTQYENSIFQKVQIAHDFLRTVLFYRKK